MKFINVVFITSFLITVSYQQDPKEEYKKLVQANKAACIKETNAKPELVEQTFNGVFADDKELMCFIKCMFVKLNYQNENGEINGDFIKKNPRPGDTVEATIAAVDDCKAPSGSDACEKAFNAAKCFHKRLGSA